MMGDKIMSASDEQVWDIAQTAAHWLREHGYRVMWDGNHACFRVVEEGIDRKDDRPLPAKYKTVGAAYKQAFRLAAGEK